MTPNPFLLAADNSPALLPLLREHPALAHSQDEHGYSLVHAAASYNHLDLLRTLITEFKVDVNLKDEDDETALFVVESPEAARVLVQGLGADVQHRGSEGLTAREKIEADGEFPAVAAFLADFGSSQEHHEAACTAASILPEVMAPPPEGMEVTLGTIDERHDLPQDVDAEFRRRIEELAQRDDFNTPHGQADLQRLVEDAIVDQSLAANGARDASSPEMPANL